MTNYLRCRVEISYPSFEDDCFHVPLVISPNPSGGKCREAAKFRSLNHRHVAWKHVYYC